MQTPPPYQQPPFAQPNQAPKNNTTKIVIIVLACVLGFFCLLVPILAAILFPVFSQAKLSAKKTACMSNVKILSTSMLIYAAEFDDTMPKAAVWNDAIRSQVGDEKRFHCPGLPHLNFGYAFADAMNAKAVTAVTNPNTEPLIFDSYLTEPNAHSDLSTLPPKPRHIGNSIGYVDGHAESKKQYD